MGGHFRKIRKGGQKTREELFASAGGGEKAPSGPSKGARDKAGLEM